MQAGRLALILRNAGQIAGVPLGGPARWPFLSNGVYLGCVPTPLPGPFLSYFIYDALSRGTRHSGFVGGTSHNPRRMARRATVLGSPRVPH